MPHKFGWPHTQPEFTKFCDAVSSAHNHIRFVEIPFLKDMSDVELDNLYVEPRFSAQEIHPDTPLFRWPSCFQPIDAIRQSSRLVLLGDPGSGKSTLVSCLAWQLCRQHPNLSSPWAKHFGGLLPLPMILRELHLKADLTWEGLLDAFLEHRIGRLLGTRKHIEALLKEGRAIILLDGLDEVGNLSIRRKLRDAVHAGMSAYPLSSWLLTSRVVGYEQVPFHIKIETVSARSNASAEVVGHTNRTKKLRTSMAGLNYMAPFNDQQIRTFAVNWYTQHEKDEGMVQTKAQDFINAIRENEGTQRLGRIPYLLTLMSLIHHKNATLPHGRTELYERIATAYLESIDLRRQLNQLPYSLAQKKRWLAAVAYRMQLRRSVKGTQSPRGDILVARSQVQQWLRAAMSDSGAKDSRTESDVLLTYFAQRSGLLLPRAEGKFAFMHLSLQEYFAACFLEPRLTASRFGSDNKRLEPSNEQLRSWANSEIWTETFVLLFELLSEKSVDETEALLDYLFSGRLKQDKTGTALSAAGLLAELATDPFVLLSAETRRLIRQQCWRWVFSQREASPSRRYYSPNSNKVIRTLLREHDGDLRKSWLASSIGMTELRRLKHLNLSGCLTLADLAPLSNLSKLKSLNLQGCTSVTNLRPLKGLGNLEALLLDGCSKINNLEPLGEMNKLEFLIIGAPCNFAPLANMKSLKSIHLHFQDEKAEVDFSPIANLPQLTLVCVPGPLRLASNGREILQSGTSPGVRRLVKQLGPEGLLGERYYRAKRAQLLKR
ncbi:MAG TPA: hypothetical protein VGH51_06500 [Candidatus Angelobacter sp.]